MTTALAIVPPAITSRATDRSKLAQQIQEYTAMPAATLVDTVCLCLRNVSHVDSSSRDGELRLVVLPELCERILPGSRDQVRRIESSLAEHWPDVSPSIFSRMLSQASRDQLRQEAENLRAQIKEIARQDTKTIVERLRFLIAGSAAACWATDDCVYEPALTFRLVPAIAWLALREASRGTGS